MAAVPSFDAEQLFTDPHLRERGTWQIIDHPRVGAFVVHGPPWRFSGMPREVPAPAPLLGQHNGYVLGELLGLGGDGVARLKREGVLR